MLLRRFIQAALCACALALAQGAPAQGNWPDRPLRLVVPFPPGGSTDIIGRVVADRLARALGQPVVVENRPGANGNIGTEAVARAAPDGLTLVLGGAANTINATLYRNLPFDLLKDLQAVAVIGITPNMMVVPNDSPARTAQEFLAWAKAQPSGVLYASSGNGASTHMAAELFKSVTGLAMSHVPYKGSAPALTDLIAGRTQVMFDNMTSALQQVKAGRLRALALTGSTRNPAVPELPTLKELGIAVEAETWFGLFVPAGTPPAVVERLNREVRGIVVQPEVKARLTEFGAELRDWDAAQVQAFTASEVRKWARVVEASGAKVD
ncbi:Bug family tripartite tricarboxylate transporter substrate binding protein [Pseudorhodoferax sp.]|uniref:Bug family tripartite tricarboxylate transporter substrate binding protein n=1 Tax=Pseudorhodoferax sp. TaxID=1993553 RepID=UPI002DD66D29|nr:tripartite tricarboxylate transporter substrate binding protein [Pseudorhodoferax sp.]